MSPNSGNTNNAFNANSDGNLNNNNNVNNTNAARPLDNFQVFVAKATIRVCIDKTLPCIIFDYFIIEYRAKVSTRTGI